jgi:hypothetical protein
LQKEAKYLEAQYEFLVARSLSPSKKKQTKRSLRRVFRQGETKAKPKDNKSLLQIVEKQQAYLENMRTLLAHAPVSDMVCTFPNPIVFFCDKWAY